MSVGRSAPRWRSVRILALALGTAASGLATASVAVTAGPASADNNNSLGATPLMGWSNWSYIGDDPTTAKIEAQAAAMKSSGLLAAGYQYLNVDDFYYLCNSNGPEVDANGRWATDTGKFPNSGSTPGMAVLGNYIHAQGEKFGMYVTPGIAANAVAANSPVAGTSFTADEIATTTAETNYNCGHMVGLNYSSPGAQDFINSWADELASWGVDYVKIDGVGSSDIPDVQAWSTALKQTGRPMWLELSNNLPIADASTWHSLANGWRTTGDIECYSCWSVPVKSTNPNRHPLTDWSNVALRFNSAAAWQPDVGPGGWGDFDSLEVGNGSNDGLTVPERQAMMTLWSMAGSPLILGTDMTSLDATDLAMLRNQAVISVDQDGAAARRVVDSGNGQVFSKRESNGDYVIALYNTSASATTTVSVPLSAVGISGSVTATNLWTGASTGTISGTYSVTLGPGAVQLIRTSGGGSGGGSVGGEVHAVGAGKCLDVPQPTSTQAPAGTQVQIYTCNAGGNQLWTHTSANALTVYSGSECLDAASNGTAPGTKVQIFTCSGQANQQWNVNSNGTITGVQSGLCLDVSGASTANGALIELWTCNGQANQQWTTG